MSSRKFLVDFFELLEDDIKKQKNEKVKSKLENFLITLKRKDLRKVSSRIGTWNALKKVQKELDKKVDKDLIDSIEGMLVDLGEKWGSTLNKYFDKIEK